MAITKQIHLRDYIYSEIDEYNILRMVKKTIIEAFSKHKGEDPSFICSKLGISVRTLYRYCDSFNIRYLINENKEFRKSYLKEIIENRKIKK